jgi:WD40 repeat protein
MWVGDADRAEVLCFGFSPDGAMLYTGDDEGAVLAWDRATHEGRELFRIPKAPDGNVAVWQVAATPCGTRLLVPGRDRVYVLDPVTGNLRKAVRKINYNGLRVSPSPDGTRFLAPTNSGVAALWDATTGERVPVHEPLGKYKNCAHAEFVPGGETVLTLSMAGGVVKLWNLPTGDEVRTFTPGNAGSLPRAMSPDGSAFAVPETPGGWGRRARELWVFDVAAGERRAVISSADPVECVAFHPSGRTLLTADNSRRVVTWNAVTGEPAGVFYPKVGDVGSVAFAPDGLTWYAGGVGRFAAFDFDG